MPRHRTNQLSPLVCAMAVTPMGRVGEGQGDLVQGLRGEDGREVSGGGDRPCRMFASAQAWPGTAPSPGLHALSGPAVLCPLLSFLSLRWGLAHSRCLSTSRNDAHRLCWAALGAL